MSDRHLIDSSVWIRMIRGDETTRRRVAELDGEAKLSLIVWGELHTGLALDPGKRQADALKHIRRMTSMNEFTPETAERYGELRAELRRAGTPIGHNDTWIAAEAMTLGQTLVTANGRHFHRVAGLDIVDVD